MKARSGFVSNSSSSSFVIIGKRITREELFDHPNVWMLGENSEYQEAFELTDEVKSAIIEHKIDGDYWEAYFVSTGSDTLSKAESQAMADAGDLEVEIITISDWSSYEQEGLEGFLQNYLEDYKDDDDDEDEE